ncbi:hypothetical protein LG293_17795 (plasmid) [Citricoccus nitrophenolicus]
MSARTHRIRTGLSMGFLLLSWGGIMLATNLKAEQWSLQVWWPTLLIALGLYFLIMPGNRYGWAVISLVTGGAVQAANLGHLTLDTMFVWWPSALVAIGMWIIFRAFIPEKAGSGRRPVALNILDRTADQFSTVVSEPQMTGIDPEERASAESGSHRIGDAPRLPNRGPAEAVTRAKGHTPARRSTHGVDIPSAPQSPPAAAQQATQQIPASYASAYAAPAPGYPPQGWQPYAQPFPPGYPYPVAAPPPPPPLQAQHLGRQTSFYPVPPV